MTGMSNSDFCVLSRDTDGADKTLQPESPSAAIQPYPTIRSRETWREGWAACAMQMNPASISISKSIDHHIRSCIRVSHNITQYVRFLSKSKSESTRQPFDGRIEPRDLNYALTSEASCRHAEIPKTSKRKSEHAAVRIGYGSGTPENKKAWCGCVSPLFFWLGRLLISSVAQIEL